MDGQPFYRTTSFFRGPDVVLAGADADRSNDRLDATTAFLVGAI